MNVNQCSRTLLEALSNFKEEEQKGADEIELRGLYGEYQVVMFCSFSYD